jgi:hypothetical protein
MTLDEAAQGDSAADAVAESTAERERARMEQELARRLWEAEMRRAADKAIWAPPPRAARDRGLDGAPAEKTDKPQASFTRPRSQRRRNPVAFASVLLQETGLPLTEIAAITQLDIYQVVGLKLKLRSAEAA